jgi:hypothetical protein
MSLSGMLQELEQHDALYVSEGDHFEEVVALARCDISKQMPQHAA